MTSEQFVVAPRRRLAGIWRPSLVGTGHLLVANSVVNAGTGVGYWLLAARLNPPGVMGVNSAAISAMMLLAGIAQLNLMSTILRFVPTAGAAAGPMIGTAYVIGGGLSGLAAAGFVLGLGLWEPHLTSLIGSGFNAAGFVIATMCWSLFVMQDNALVAVRRPAAVPVENLSFSVLKILLVVALSQAMPGAGIWRSWAAAMVITVAGTTLYLFRRAVPAFASTRSLAAAEVASVRDLTRFIGPDYVGALAYLAGTSLVPLLVLKLTGPRESAAFALAWSICAALYQVPIAFGQSLVAHGATHTDRLARYHRQALTQTLRLLVPVVALAVALAPLGLRFFGGWYASQGTVTLRLLALSALPNAVVALAVSRARVARRMRFVMVTLVSLCGLVLALTLVLVPRVGIAGGGIAWLAAQLAVAAGVLGHGRISAFRTRRVSAGAAVPRALTQAALASGGWQPEESLPTVSDSAVTMIRSADGQAGVLKLASSSAGAASLLREDEILRRLRSESRLGDWRSLLPVPLRAGTLDGGAYLMTSRLPGQDGREVLAELGSWLTPAAVNAIAPLHRLGPARQVIGDALLAELVHEPAALLRGAVRRASSVDRLAAILHDELAGQWVTLSWTHGDFYPGNVLVGESKRVTGIVDWSQAREQGLAAADIAFWLLTMPRPGEPRELGARVAARLVRGAACWQPAETRLLQTRMAGDDISGRAVLLLAWLRHVTDNLAKSDRYAASPLWGRRNILPVLRWADGQGEPRKELSA